MAFKNPWGNGSDEHDKWFKNLWTPDSAKFEDVFPSVDHWDINTGTVSEDNKCYIATTLGVSKLGLDCDPSGWSNGIELKAFIKNHKKGFSYDITRMKEYALWEKIDDVWTKDMSASSTRPEDDDTPQNKDEYLVPQSSMSSDLHYIYSMDRPGVGSGPRGSFWSKGCKIFVWTWNMIETVHITKDLDRSFVDDTLTQKWCCHLYININHEGPGGRSMDMALSYIGAGHKRLDSPANWKD